MCDSTSALVPDAAGVAMAAMSAMAGASPVDAMMLRAEAARS